MVSRKPKTPEADSARLCPTAHIPEVVNRNRVLARELVGPTGHATRGLVRPTGSGPTAQQSPHLDLGGDRKRKTQADKAILHDFLPQGLPALILDFKDDYSKSRVRATRASPFTMRRRQPAVQPDGAADRSSERTSQPHLARPRAGQHAPAHLQAR